ncbi:MAG: hypothetical protein QOF48_2274, partial [Verrucomicrobiota bacterium]
MFFLELNDLRRLEAIFLHYILHSFWGRGQIQP